MSQLQKVLHAIDAINSADINLTIVDGISHPKELLYGQYMSACLDNYWPDASECLQTVSYTHLTLPTIYSV